MNYEDKRMKIIIIVKILMIMVIILVIMEEVYEYIHMLIHTYTHAHTYSYIYIYIHILMHTHTQEMMGGDQVEVHVLRSSEALLLHRGQPSMLLVLMMMKEVIQLKMKLKTDCTNDIEINVMPSVGRVEMEILV